MKIVGIQSVLSTMKAGEETSHDRIASGFKCVPDTAVGKTGRIRFLLDKQFAREAFYNITVITEFNKAVVAFRQFRQSEAGTNECSG